jgi:hypothetical protein
MSLAWTMCSTSMARHLIRNGPVVCFDESPTQLIGEIRQPIPAAPGQPRRYDYPRNIGVHGTTRLQSELEIRS